VAGDAVSLARLRGRVVDTGQAVEIDAPRRRKRRRGWRDKVGMIDYTLLARLEVTGLEGRILAAVMAHVPEKGGREAYCTMQEIADFLGVKQTSVSRAMKGLKERHILWLVKQGKWRVNAWLTYNGDFDSWGAEAEQDPEPVWARGADPVTGEVK
jgi:hypothetical protein